MSSSSSAIFNGTSRYSSDFQSVIQRAVAIASLPLQSLQAGKTQLSDESSALSSIQNRFTAVASAIDNINSATAGSTGASVADSTVVQASVSSDAADGTYSIEVTSLGSFSTSISKSALTAVADPYADNISSAGSFTLTINGTAQTITPAGTSLMDLANAINSSSADVQATVVNMGSTAAPSYRLAVRSTKTAADTIQLNDGSADLLDTVSTGANATYKLNGVNIEVRSDSRTVTIAPGLTVNLLKQSAAGVPDDITVSHNYGQLQSAISSFADAYNAAVDSLDAQRGKDAGPLSGQSVIFSLSNSLRQLIQYSDGSGTTQTLADIGLTLGSDGKLTFDSTAFNASGPDAVKGFLGQSDSSGFLKLASDIFSSITDSTSGLLQDTLNSYQDQIKRQDDLISANQDRIDTLQTNLQAQMAASDALIATLEQQVTYMTNLFNTMTFGTANSTKAVG